MKQNVLTILFVLGLMVSFSFTDAYNNNPENDLEEAVVSYYGKKFHGKLTASGEVFNMNDLTCAHKTLKFGTKVEFTNPKNGKTIIVKVNDRGPFIKGRKFDLSKGAFAQIADINQGVVKLKYRILK